MARRKKSPVKHAKPSAEWLVTFGDLLTLLITFFVLLISMSSMDRQKLKKTFGFFKGASAALERGKGVARAESDMSAEARPEQMRKQSLGHSPGAIGASLAKQIKMIELAAARLKRRLRDTTLGTSKGNHPLDEDVLARLEDSRPVRVTRRQRHVDIDLHLGLLFVPGTPRLRPEARQLIRDVGRIEARGLTLSRVDTPPLEHGLETRLFSPWDLAVWRSAAVIRALQPPTPPPASAALRTKLAYVKLVFAR